MLFHFRDKVTLAAVEGVYALGVFEGWLAEAAAGVDKLELRVLFQKVCDNALVFIHGKGAGGVYEDTVGANCRGSAVEYRFLALRASHAVLDRPFVDSFLILAEHTLARARRVDQHLVEEALEPAAQVVGAHVGYNGVLDAHALDIREQDVSSGAHDLVSPQQTRAGKLAGYLGAFAAGSSAEVEHLIAGLYAQHGDRRHSRRLLYIEGSRVVQRMLA